MFPLVYQAGILPAGRNRILPPRLDPGQLFYAPLTSSLLAIGAGTPTPTFVRASGATFHTGAGKIGTVGSGVPRFEKYGMLFEGPRTNTAIWSDDLTQSPPWTKFNVTVAGDAIASPYVGSPVIADKVQEDGTNDWHDIYQNYTGVANQKDTMSVYVKAGERTWVYIGWFDANGNAVDCHFNTATGTYGTINVGGPDGVTIHKGPFAEQLADGWWRLSVVIATKAQTNRNLDFGLLAGDGITLYTGTPGWGAYFIGGMAELNAFFPSSLIPTTTVPVTRVQDRLTYPGPGNTPLGPIGSIECEFRHKNIHSTGEPGVTCLSTQSVVNQFGAECLFGFNNGTLCNVISNSLQQQAVGISLTGKDITWHMVWAFQPFTASLYLDGIQEGFSGTNSNLPNHSQISVGAAGSGGNFFWGWIRNVKIWEIRLWL